MTAHVHAIGDLKGEPAGLLALAAGKSYRDAAHDAGVTLRTISRRMQDPGYRQRVQEERAAMIAQASGQLAERAAQAVTTLSGLLEAQSEQVRLGAARAILDLAGRYRELVEIAERVDELERRLDDHQRRQEQSRWRI